MSPGNEPERRQSRLHKAKFNGDWFAFDFAFDHVHSLYMLKCTICNGNWTEWSTIQGIKLLARLLPELYSTQSNYHSLSLLSCGVRRPSRGGAFDLFDKQIGMYIEVAKEDQIPIPLRNIIITKKFVSILPGNAGCKTLLNSCL